MSDEIKRGRSPSCPQITLNEAIELVKKLYAKAGKAAISRETAAGAFGFASLHGSALSTLAGLNQYGLIDADRGGNLRVSDLSLRLIHPLNPAQTAEGRRDAALRPRVFSELLEGGYADCDVQVLTNHLVQSGFTPMAAGKVATVFKENAEFANLADGRMVVVPDNKLGANEQLNFSSKLSAQGMTGTPHTATQQLNLMVDPGHGGKPQTGEYRFFLDPENEVEIRFFGTQVGMDQLDALSDYIEVFKRRFERKQKAAPRPAPEVVNVPPSYDTQMSSMDYGHGPIREKESEKSQYDE